MKKLHLICNAHIDTIWQWEWAEGMSAALSTFQSAANLMEKHDYIFCHNEATLYKYTEKYAPALFARIQELVKAGKWHLIGAWYLQPDCLMASGESYIRQIREGILFFEEKFGCHSKTAVNFDSFGHSRGLVQIIKKCGQENYLFMRPFSKHIWEQLKLPREYFLWEGYDGSTVKAFRGTEYNAPLGEAAKKIQLDMQRLQDEEETISLWGVGNHGGGPSDKDLTDIEALMASSDVQIIHSTPDAFFSQNMPQARFDGSLISCNIGCYTAMVGLKQKFRELQRELFSTEKLLSICALKGICSFPTEQIKGITENLLTVMFHDVLPGTCIKAGEDNAMRFIDHGLQELEQLKLDCFFGLIRGQAPAAEETYPIFVYNPKTYDGEQLVECELSVTRHDEHETVTSTLRLFDEQGNPIPCQTVKEAGNINLDWRKKIAFKAKLNPLGLTRFTAKTVVEPKRRYPFGQDVVFDNGYKHVRISAETGLLESYVIQGKEYARGGMFGLYAYQDHGDPWDMNPRDLVEGIGTDPQPFTHMQEPDGVFRGLQRMEVIEDGDIYLGVETFFAWGLTRARIAYKIYKDGPEIDVDVEVFPAEVNTCIKLHLPTLQGGYIGQQVFGTELLYTDGRECIAQDFVAVELEDHYLQILTPDCFGSSYRDGTVCLTLLRGASYLAHPYEGRPLLRENTFVPKLDMEHRSFRIRLLPALEQQLQYNADLFAERPFAQNIFPTVDTVQDNGYTVTTSDPSIALVTMFKARETDGYLLRLQNNSSRCAGTTVTCGGVSVRVDFGKYEVKTLRLLDGCLEEVPEFII